MPRLGFGKGEDRGATLVEMALVITLLVMLLVGIVTAAVAYGRGNSIQNAVREASRYGATLPDGGTLSWFEDVRDVARSAATGDLDASVTNEQICVAFILEDDSAVRLVDVGGMDGGVVNGSCFDDGRDGNGEARVQVVAQRDSPINAVLFSVDISLEAEAAARYER